MLYPLFRHRSHAFVAIADVLYGVESFHFGKSMGNICGIMRECRFSAIKNRPAVFSARPAKCKSTHLSNPDNNYPDDRINGICQFKRENANESS